MSIHFQSGLFGTRLGAMVGMSESPPGIVHSGSGGLFAATRISLNKPGRAGRTKLPVERAYALFLDLADDCTTIRDLREPGTFDFGKPLDLIALYLPYAVLAHHAVQTGKSFGSLAVPKHGVADMQIRHLCQCLMTAMENGAGASTFIESIIAALCVYLLCAFDDCAGGADFGGRLAPWQLRRARKLLMEDLCMSPSIADLAAECRLSVSHFARAFRHSTGTSPHQWLMQQRVAMAKTLLANEQLSLALVALECGFADQSHFTRIFAKSTGVPPGRWRRAALNSPDDTETTSAA